MAALKESGTGKPGTGSSRFGQRCPQHPPSPAISLPCSPRPGRSLPRTDPPPLCPRFLLSLGRFQGDLEGTGRPGRIAEYLKCSEKIWEAYSLPGSTSESNVSRAPALGLCFLPKRPPHGTFPRLALGRAPGCWRELLEHSYVGEGFISAAPPCPRALCWPTMLSLRDSAPQQPAPIVNPELGRMQAVAGGAPTSTG